MACMNARTKLLCGLIALTALALPVVCLGAGDGYDVPTSKPAKPWLAVVYAVVSLAGIAVLAIKNAKRSHLD